MSYTYPFNNTLQPININTNHIPSPSAPLLSPNFSPPRTQRTQRNNYDYLLPDDLLPEDSEQELQLFANYLGFSLKKYPQFLHIVLQALKEPLPSGWTEIKEDNTDNIYFYNTQLKYSTWEHPLDFYYKEIIKRQIKKNKDCVIQ